MTSAEMASGETAPNGEPAPNGETAPNGEPAPNGGAAPNGEPAPSEPATWTIGQIADEFAVTHRTVRHYEELGLICPERRGTVRIYHRRDRARLNLILRGKRLGFPLEEIRTIINLYDEPRGQASQLSYVLDQINARHTDLERRRRDIEEALKELDAFERRCRADLEALRRG